MNAAAWFHSTSFHTTRETPAPAPTKPYVDTRPRIKYAFPDGRVAMFIIDHDEVPKPMISLALSVGDPLWDKAQRVAGSTTRIVWLTLAQGL